MKPSAPSTSSLVPLLGAALCLVAVGAAAQPGGRLDGLFPQRAVIEADAAGLQRLDLPADVLVACRPDLSDVRIVDAGGREVPWILLSGKAAPHGLRRTRTVDPQVLEVERHRTDPESGPATWLETYTLEAPPEPTGDGSWDLVFHIRAPSFVRRLRVLGIDGAGNAVELPLSESLFRFADATPPSSAVRERTRVSLPPVSLRRLQVILEGEDGGYLEPSFTYESTQVLTDGETATMELEPVFVGSRGSTTIVELERPRGLVPDAIVLHTATQAFRRTVRVLDRGSGAGGAPLGEGLLYRLADGIENRRLPIQPAAGERLRLEIEDGDSPPLESIRVEARLRQPALVFALAGGADTATATLLFGGGRTFFPRYDVAGLLPSLPAVGAAADLADVLRDPASLPAARLGPREDNPAFDRTPRLAFAMRPGAEIDVRRFSHRRRLHAPENVEGLIRLQLTPEDLAVARPDLADVRIVDDDDRQRGYLIQLDARRPLIELDRSKTTSREGVSIIELVLPAAPITVDGLEIDSPLPFFDRQMEVVASLPRSASGGTTKATLSRERLVRRLGDAAPQLFFFPTRRIRGLELRIVDGDDAPLDLNRIRASVPLPEVYFAAPPGEYTLLLGDPDAERPTYEIQRARSLVLSVASSLAESGELEESPRFSAASRWSSGTAAQRVLVWSALALAAVVMVVLTLRAARREGNDGE